MVIKGHVMDFPLFKDWLKEKKQVSDGTVQVYGEVVERLLRENLDLEDLESYNSYIIKYAIKKRCYHYHAALKAFIQYKIEDASIRNRLIDGLIVPPLRTDIAQERKYLNQEQIIQIINNLEKPKHRIIALIQSLTGIRAGDILRLKRDNIVPEVYEDAPVLRMNILGKGKKRNVVYIHDEIAQELIMEYIINNFNHDEYYFIELGTMKNRKGNTENEFRLVRMNYWWFWADLKQALQTVGADIKDFATHDFRRCFARRVWEKYKDIQVLKSLLGHKDINVTMRYLEQSGLKNVEYHKQMQN